MDFYQNNNTVDLLLFCLFASPISTFDGDNDGFRLDNVPATTVTFIVHTQFLRIKFVTRIFFLRDNEDSRRLLIITCLLLVDFHYQAALIAYPKAIYECFCVCVYQV